jgi:hypothetical protein
MAIVVGPGHYRGSLVVIGKEVVVVAVSWPLQLSVAVGAVRLVTEHCAVTLERVAVLATGAVTSFTITFV